MKNFIIFLLIALLAVNAVDYAELYEISDMPYVGKYLDLNNYPLIGGYQSHLEGITLPRYTGADLWGDMDGDGVINVYDCCWDEPTNWLGVYFGTGCPDSDYDTIANYWDECPSVAGVSGSLSSPLGCPPPAPVIPVQPPTTPPTTTTTDTNTTATNTNASTTNATDAPPFASFSLEVDGLKVYVDGSTSTDDVNVTQYLWNWGDGQVSTGVSSNHIYETEGEKYVTLTVIDTRGQINMKVESVTIDDGSAISPATNKFIGFLIFIGIIILIILLSSPRARKGVIMFGKKQNILPRGNTMLKTPRVPKVMPPAPEKKVAVRAYYRNAKGEGSGKGFL